jgi:hypothetical protein
MAEMMVPKLTTLEPPSEGLGRLATEQLIKHLEGKGDENPRILIPCCLIVGESSGPNRSISGDLAQPGGATSEKVPKLSINHI